MTQLVLPRTAVAPLIVLVLRRVVAGAIGLALAVAPSRADGAQTPSLASLQDAYNKGVYRGIVAMRAPADVGDGHVVGDNTDPNGMRWTKCANLGLDLIATLVADARGIVARGEAREHVSKVVDVLAGLTTYAGIFPEVISFDGGIRPEMVEGRVRYSSIDSAWVTVALSLVDGAYRGKDEGLAARARALIEKQDYTVFVDANGALGAGLWADARTGQRDEAFPFAYDDLNSEARPLVNALVGLGKLPVSAWGRMQYRWVRKDGAVIARGWHLSAFVEMTGQIFMDEATEAPHVLGRSHAGYLEATLDVARRHGHAVFGYAPACDLERGYSEYGLDRPDIVSPYAAAELAAGGDARALSNLEKVLGAMATDGHPLPDGVESKSGAVYCTVARTLDQALLFLGLNADAVWQLARQTTWFASAEQRIRDLDRTARPPDIVPALTEIDAGQEAVPVEAARSSFSRRSRSQAERAASVGRARGLLRNLLDATRSAEWAPGGGVAASDAERHHAMARAATTWMDALLPRFSGVARRQQDSLTLPGAPSFWLEVQAQAVVSPQKFAAGVADSEAVRQSEASTRSRERGALVECLSTYAELFLAERQAARLGQHAQALRDLAQRVGAEATAAGELASLEAQRAAVAAKLAGADSRRRQAVVRLMAMARRPIGSSGLDPELDLADVLSVLSLPLGAGEAAVEEAAASLAYQVSELRLAETRMPYVPELRASVLGVLARPPITSGNSKPAWSTDQVLGQATVDFTLRPASAKTRDAEKAGVAAGLCRFRDVRETIRDLRAEARAARQGAVSSWSAGARALDSDATFVRAAGRFARGECDVASLVHASKSLVAARESTDAIFRAGVRAQVALSAQGEGDDSSLGQEDGADDPGVPAGACEGATNDAAARAAAADAVRARDAANAARSTFGWKLSMGVLYPFVTSEGVIVGGSAGALSTNAAALLPAQIRRIALLTRVSLNDRLDSREASAAALESALAASRAILAQRSFLAKQAATRIEVAFAKERLSQAMKRATFAETVLAAMRAMKNDGTIDDEVVALEGEAPAAAAAADRETEHASWQQAEGRARRLLGGGFSVDPLEAVEGGAWVDSFYSAHGLFGFEAELRTRVADLTLQHAKASYEAVVSGSAAVDVALQGTQEFGGDNFSLGLGLSWALDPPSRAPHAAQAAERVGRAEGELAATRAAIDSERRLAETEVDEATRVREIAVQRRDRVASVLAGLREEQAGEAQLHDASKLRTLARVEAMAFESELALTRAYERVAVARLAAMNLGVKPGQRSRVATRTSAGRTSLATAVARLVDVDPDVLVATESTHAMDRVASRPAFVGALHVAGPAFGATLSRAPSAGGNASTSDTATGYAGAGISFALDEAPSFLDTSARQRAARLGRDAAVLRARSRALGAIAIAWTAREADRLESSREQALQRAEQLAAPRFNAAQIGADALAGAQSAYAAAQIGHLAAQGARQRSAAWLAERGVALSDAALDEFGRYVAEDSDAPIERALAAIAASSSSEQPEVERVSAERSAASADALMAFLRLVDPVTLFTAIQPFGAWPDMRASGANQAPAVTRGAEWDVAVRTGLNLGAIGEMAQEATLIGERQGELEAIRRVWRESLATRRARLETSASSWRSSLEWRAAARHALEEVDRRYRAGEADVSIDARFEAQNDAFDAERSELEARGVLLELLAESQLALVEGAIQ